MQSYMIYNCVHDSVVYGIENQHILNSTTCHTSQIAEVED